MLNGQPELPIVSIYVKLDLDSKVKNKVAYGSLGFGVGDRVILSKTFTVFRSERTGGLYVKWPSFQMTKDGKPEWREFDIWVDNDEGKYWANRVIDEVNRQMGVTPSTTPKTQPEVKPAAATVEAPAPSTSASGGRRVGWKPKG